MLRDPKHTESVFDIEDGLRDLKAYQLVLEHIKSDPAVARIIEERYLAPPHDMAALGRLPDGTFGKAFWHHIEDNGFDPDYYRKIEVASDLDYVLMRVRQTHDVWHVVTGIGTDQIGEIALKAFELCQLRRPMAAVIAAGGVFRYLLKDPRRSGQGAERDRLRVPAGLRVAAVSGAEVGAELGAPAGWLAQRAGCHGGAA